MRDPMSLYPVDNPYPQARATMGQAASSYGAMGQNRTTTTEEPGKTAGGGMMAGLGGAAAGAMAGAEIGAIGGPWGAAIGAGVGMAAYYLG